MYLNTENKCGATYIDYYSFHEYSAILYYDDWYFTFEDDDEFSHVRHLMWIFKQDQARYVILSSVEMTR